ncbi:MAG: cell division protein ZapA [Pseudomonadota bacterium]
MPQIDITLNGRRYPVNCQPGDEDRVRSVAAFVDSRLAELKANAASVSDTQLLVLVSLLLADELFDMREQIKDGLVGDDQELAGVIARLTSQVESLTTRIEN